MIQSDNKRIAKNTIFLYIRMLFSLMISLYASRVILQLLGVDDYGIFTVVGGVVSMFSFIYGALTVGTQRHLSFELGRQGGNLPQLFSACLHIHIILSIGTFVLLETLGLWFLNTQMNFPEDRLFSANVVYQFSILCFICKIIQAPYDGAVIAFEKMSFYAYVGIIEAILKLVILYFLILVSYDKLVFYSVLHFCVILFILLSVVIFCHKKLDGIYLTPVRDKSIYKFIISFSTWTLFGSLANLMESQGMNILINIFYGVAINAAVGIAVQVRGALTQFVNGFQQSLNPQLVKAHSSGARERQADLIFKSSKFSFYILFLLAFPIMVNLDYILGLWLTEVPPYTVEICYLIIIVSLVECLSSPLYTTIFAIGDIKVYQIVVFILKSLCLILGYLICKMEYVPYAIYYVSCIVAVLLLIYRLLFVNKAISLSVKAFLNETVYPIIKTILLIIVPVLWFKYYFAPEISLWVCVFESVAVVIFSSILIFFLGIKGSERVAIVHFIKSKMSFAGRLHQ